MFEKNKEEIKKVTVQSEKFYKDKDIILTNSFIEMMNYNHQNKELKEKEEYQLNITNYINKKQENSIKKRYDSKIVNLYHSGKLVIDNNEYQLKDFFIVFNDKLNNFHIKCIDTKFKNEEIEYNRAVKFIDTTAFINLVETNDYKDNKIIISDLNTLNNVVSKWDGYLHDRTLETDSVINKKIIKDDKDE